MNRRSKNSRPHEDRALRDHYRDQNSACELSAWMKRHYRAGLTERELSDPSAEVNHIFSLGQRPDKWTNLITLSHTVHMRVFHGNLPDGRLLSIFTKYRKNELNFDEFRACAGKRLEGYLLMNPTENPWLLPLWRELLAHAEKNEPN